MDGDHPHGSDAQVLLVEQYLFLRPLNVDQDQEDVAGIVLPLGALTPMAHVLDRELVDAERRLQKLEVGRFGSLDIKPEGATRGSQGLLQPAEVTVLLQPFRGAQPVHAGTLAERCPRPRWGHRVGNLSLRGKTSLVCPRRPAAGSGWRAAPSNGRPWLPRALSTPRSAPDDPPHAAAGGGGHGPGGRTGRCEACRPRSAAAESNRRKKGRSPS